MAKYSISQITKKTQAPKDHLHKKRSIKVPPAEYLYISAGMLILIGFFTFLLVKHFSAPGMKTTPPAVSNKTATEGKKAASSTLTTSTAPTKIYNLPDTVFTSITSGITKKNVGSLGKYYSNGVKIVDLYSHLNVFLAPNQASILIGSSLNGATTWNWQVPADELAAWQAGPYGQYFTGNDLIGISDNGYVVSIQFNPDGQIVSVFIAPITTLSPNGSNTGGTGSSTGSQTTNPINGPGGGD